LGQPSKKAGLKASLSLFIIIALSGQLVHPYRF